MSYPYQFGYCDTPDVQARIKQGVYDPDAPGEITTGFLTEFITQSAAEIDATLLRSGYGVLSGGGLCALPQQTIWPQVWSMLLNINATMAAGQVELWRHSQDANSEDTQAQRLMTLADDMLARIETGAVNFMLMGVAGPFEPEADPSGAMASGPSLPPLTLPGNSRPLFSVIPSRSERGPDPLRQW